MANYQNQNIILTLGYVVYSSKVFSCQHLLLAVTALVCTDPEGSTTGGLTIKLTHAVGVTLAQLVKASVGQSDVRRFEPHLGHNLLSCGVFLVKSRHFGLPLAQSIRPNWKSLLAGGSVAIQTWSIYKVYI